MSLTTQDSSHGLDWRLELERDWLLPGTLVAGSLSVVAHHDVEARGLIVALRATEQWQHEVTTTDANGHTSTRTATERRQLVSEPVQVAEDVRLAKGESRTWSFELPVPPLGPATLEATVAALTWCVEAKLDTPGGLDSSIEMPVRVAQPVALLRSGAVPVGEFALYDSADVADDGASGSITLSPVPLCVGAPFHASIVIEPGRPRKLQEIRVEIRVHVEATVSSGKDETLTVWSGVVPITELAAEQTFTLEGTVPDVALPTIELPHGRTSATVHVILATAFASDPHLVRDIAIATTREL